MFREERQILMVGEIQRRGSASVVELAEMFRVSKVTVRNDLAEMAREGHIQRTHGGAMLTPVPRPAVAMEVRALENAPEKEAIGRLAATLVRPGETVMLDFGTTLHRMAAHIGDVERLVCVSLDPAVASEASQSPVVSVVLTGGYCRADLQLWGPVCLRTIQEFSPADRAFVGVSGISPDEGLTTAFLPGVATKQALVRAAREVIVLADSSKLVTNGPYRFGDLSTVHKVVTSQAAPRAAVEALRRAGLEVLLA